MKALYELKDMLCEELEKISEKGELTAGSLDAIDKLAHSIKNIDKIIMSEEEYSNNGGWEARGMYSNTNYGGGSSYRGGNSYGMGNSYARKRDSMGRYARRGYSRADGKSDMIEELEVMMNQVSSEKEREAIRRCIDSMEQA